MTQEQNQVYNEWCSDNSKAENDFKSDIKYKTPFFTVDKPKILMFL